MSFLHYFHAAISNHLSEKPKICLGFIWSLRLYMSVFCCFQADFELAPNEKRLTKAQQIYEKYLQPGVSVLSA